ncbi:MAG: Fe-S cluster assembly protein SufD [Elusimicrobia bacterium]|nr:Fe-S cluster assembly protein SufD [Elusimicrobiota bacterium]
MTATQELSSREARRGAWKTFQQTLEPARTVETWRRVSFSAWRMDALTDGQSSSGFKAALDPEAAKLGVILSSIDEAPARFSEVIRAHLSSWIASPDFRKLEAANLSQFRGGAFLYIPKGARLEKPVRISFAHRDAYEFPRLFAVIEDGAEASIVEEHFQDGASAKVSSVAFSHVTLGRGAKARWFYQQTLPGDASHFWHQRAEVGQDALLQHYSAILGGSVHKSELDVRLSAPGARSELKGVVFGEKSQAFDPHTNQDHRAPKTSSDLLYRTALKDKARAIFTGLIRVEKDAKGTEAYQQNNNVLLSNAARADSTPVLEILTDDVRCKHGATVGPLSADERFYLESRGLSPEEATKVLLMGLFDHVLGQTPVPERVVAEIERRLA